jgi:putative CocE/NonD family hydrolase
MIDVGCSSQAARLLAGLIVVLALWLSAVGAEPASGAASTDPGNGSWQPGPQRYGMTNERTDVRMSDGVYLNATITRPTDPRTGLVASGRFPVLVTFTPYGKDEPVLQGVNVTPASDFVPYGYVHVTVDVRGTGSSSGTFELFGHREVQDYVEVIQWAAHLSESDGQVGLVGESYLALAQLFAAGAVGPGSPLKAIFPIDTGADLYRDSVVPGGMFNNLAGTPYAGLEIGMDSLGPATSGHPLPQAIQDLGLHLEGNSEIDGRTLADSFNGGDRAYDQDFYSERDLSAAIARIPRNGVAVFAYNALFDIWQRGDPLVYSILQNAAAGRPPFGPMAPDQRPDPRYQVVLGPYVHVESGTLLASRLGRLALEWFDTWLKGQHTGMAQTPTPLHTYELEGGRWAETSGWPPPTVSPRTLYFAAGPSGSRAPSRNDGTLSDNAPKAAGSDELPWNGGFNSPCSRGTYQQANEFIFAPSDFDNPCFYDDRGLELGALTYTTAPLKQPLDIAGPATVTVHASANTANTEWVVTLNDVAPDGTARPFATGDLIGSLRDTDPSRGWTLGGRDLMPWHPFTRASEQAVRPGEVESYEIELPGTVARIARGHRIRITVQSSDAPYLEPDFPDQNQLMGGTYHVQRGGPRPSNVTLPVIQPGDLETSTVDWGPCPVDCGTRDLAAEQMKTPTARCHRSACPVARRGAHRRHHRHARRRGRRGPRRSRRLPPARR